jgi:AraC-like DNA-binding protein
MSLVTGFLQTLILLGGLQGLIISSALFLRRAHRQTNRLLAGVIFLLALASVNLWLTDQPWIGSAGWLILFINVVPMVVVMPVGPLLFFYARSVRDPSFRLTRECRFHFYTVIIDIVPQLTAILYFTGLAVGWFRKDDAPWGQFIDTYNVYADIPRWLSISIYLFVTWRYLNRLNPVSPSSYLKKWPQQLIIVFSAFQLIWLFYLIPYVIPAYTDKLLGSLGWFPIYIPMTILIYWLGFRGYFQLQESPVTSKRESSAVLTADQIRETIAALEMEMNEKHVYLRPALDLSMMSERTGIPPKLISAVINQHLQTSFSAYVNGYRVEAIKKKLLDGSNKHLSIAGLAKECGFNSQPTFQRAFKTLAGMTPKEFIEKNRVSGMSKYT